MTSTPTMTSHRLSSAERKRKGDGTTICVVVASTKIDEAENDAEPIVLCSIYISYFVKSVLYYKHKYLYI